MKMLRFKFQQNRTIHEEFDFYERVLTVEDEQWVIDSGP